MINTLKDIWTVLSIEVRRVFGDRMVLLIFFLAPLLYPLIFCYMYHNENVEDMAAMFYGCSNIERVDLSSFDTRNVVNMEYLFFQCGKLTTVYAGDGWSIEKLTFDTGDMMFWDCTSLVGGEGQQCDGITLVSYLFAKIDEPASPGYFTYKSSNPDTAIQKVIVKREKDYYYSINGQRHSIPVKGINIKNGKKYMVR